MFDKLDLLQFKQRQTPSTFILFNEIDMEIAGSTAEWILNSNALDQKPDVLNLMICSPGGDLHAAWAIIDLIQGSTIPIRTIGLGQVASAGLLILTSGHKGLRVLSENCSVMSHQYMWGVSGKHHELMAAQKEYTLTHARLIKHFKKTCKLSDTEIESLLMPAHDVYMDAHEALKFGLCDTVKTLK